MFESFTTEKLVFARLPIGGERSQTDKIGIVKAHCSEKISKTRKLDRKSSDARLGFVGTEVNARLFSHRLQIGPQRKYDQVEPVSILGTKTYSAENESKYLSWLRSYTQIQRRLELDWDPGNGLYPAKVILQCSQRMSREWSFDAWVWTSSDNCETFNEIERIQLVKHLVKRIGAQASFFEMTDVDKRFAGYFPKGLRRAKKDDPGASFSIGPFQVTYDLDRPSEKYFFSPVFSHVGNEPDLEQGILHFEFWCKAVRDILGPPKRIQYRLDTYVKYLPRVYPAVCKLGRVVPYQEFTSEYRGKFDPLQPQEVRPGEVRAYPLFLVVTDPKSFHVPLTPLLAVNAVHASDGSWIELQSTRGREWIGEAVKILGGKAEYYEGPDPAERWGWYTEPLAPLPFPEKGANDDSSKRKVTTSSDTAKLPKSLTMKKKNITAPSTRSPKSVSKKAVVSKKPENKKAKSIKKK